MNIPMDGGDEAIDNLLELLQDKIDLYTEKEQALEDRERRCVLKERSLTEQLSLIKSISSLLSKELQDKFSQLCQWVEH